MAVTFKTLRTDATIFSELDKMDWWKRFKTEKSLYIEIRKDNQVNVYFEGGSIARIHYCSKHKKLQVFTHHKYLGISNSHPTYVECGHLIGTCLDEMMQRVKQEYSQRHLFNGVTPKEKWSEKYIQANVILQSPDSHLDSEFAYKDAKCDIRIDLIKVIDGKITFVELKRLDDPRMLKRSDDFAEVVGQMKNYTTFIAEHKNDLLDYYQRVYSIKQRLGLPLPHSYPETVDPIPQLFIFNRWEKSHPARENHTHRMEQMLALANIDYKIINQL